MFHKTVYGNQITTPEYQISCKAKKKKIGLFPVSRPTLFFGADPKLFFQLSKENSNKEKKNGEKINKIRWTVQKLQAIEEIAL